MSCRDMQGIVRSVWDAVEFCCVAIPWREMIATPGEWELSELVRQQRIPLPSPDLPSVSEVRHSEEADVEHAFTSLGARGPRGTVPATSWRAVAEDALDRWWRDAHGVTPKTSVRFENARSQVLRGVPRIRRGAGAGEFLETPARSSTPLERRGVAREWIAAFVLWMHELRLFKLPTRVFIDTFAKLLTAAVGGTADGTTTDGATLFDFIPIAFRCEPQILACHAADDDLYSLLVATQHAAAAPWLSFIAASPHTRRDPHAVAAVVDACDGGVVVSLAGRGEPDEAIRPLLLSWNLLEICCARSAETPPQTDPYAPPQLPRVRLAITCADDDVERHAQSATRSRYFLIRSVCLHQRIAGGKVSVVHVPDPENPSDYFTKFIGAEKTASSIAYSIGRKRHSEEADIGEAYAVGELRKVAWGESAAGRTWPQSES